MLFRFESSLTLLLNVINMDGKMILIEHEVIEQILKEIEHMKEILTNNHVGR